MRLFVTQAVLLALAGIAAAVSSPPDFPAPVYGVDLDAPPRSRWTAAVVGQIDRHGWDATYVFFTSSLSSSALGSLLELTATPEFVVGSINVIFTRG